MSFNGEIDKSITIVTSAGEARGSLPLNSNSTRYGVYHLLINVTIICY